MTPLHELKHSIQTHMIIFGGPSTELAAYLLKLVDLVEDTDLERRDQETLQLAAVLAESVGLHIQRTFDERANLAAESGQPFPPRIKQAGDLILLTIGKWRSWPDKLAKKNAILTVTAAAIRELASHTQSKYPTITDSSNNPL